MFACHVLFLAVLALGSAAAAAEAKHVVLVHGYLGWGGEEENFPLKFWGEGHGVPSSGLTVHESSVGPFSSSHDRACELAAQIKGTVVDYGEEHSAEHGHARYGTDYSVKGGFVPDWSSSNPVHFVAHSLGTATVRCLQHLLEMDYWGWGSDHTWVRSITGLSSVMNGTPMTIMYGAVPTTGVAPDGSTTLTMVMQALASMAGDDTTYNFRLSQWGLERRPGESAGDFAERIRDSSFSTGSDNAFHSISVAAERERNAVWKTYNDTHYFSYITEQTTKGLFSSNHYPDFRMNAFLYPSALWMGTASYEVPFAGYDVAQWRENDGVIPSYAQVYPRTGGEHRVGIEFSRHETNGARFAPGEWHYTYLRGWDHVDIVYMPQWDQQAEQARIYTSIYARLASL